MSKKETEIFLFLESDREIERERGNEIYEEDRFKREIPRDNQRNR